MYILSDREIRGNKIDKFKIKENLEFNQEIAPAPEIKV